MDVEFTLLHRIQVPGYTNTICTKSYENLKNAIIIFYVIVHVRHVIFSLCIVHNRIKE